MQYEAQSCLGFEFLASSVTYMHLIVRFSSDCFKTAIVWYLLARWKPRYLWNQVFKLSAKLVYETEQLPLKNSFFWPLVYLGARQKTSWTLKQGDNSLQSANLFNPHPKGAKAISASKGEKIRLSQADKS